MRDPGLLFGVVLLLALAAYTLYPRKRLVAYLLWGISLSLVGLLIWQISGLGFD